jgi:hypothetical protein
LEIGEQAMTKRPTERSKATDQAAPARPKPRKTKAAAAGPGAPSGSEPSIDDIRRRAYERYLERGGRHGAHFDDWLEAEKELRTKK